MLAVGLTVPARGEVRLAWKFNQGDVFYVETASRCRQTMTALERAFKQDVEQTTVLRFTVKEKTQDQVVLEERIESMKVRDAARSGTVDDRTIQQMQGASFTVTLGPKGDVVKFAGYEPLLKGLAGDDLKIRNTIQAAMTEDALKKSAREAFAFLPDKPVNPGATWERTSEDALGPLGAMSRTATYTYVGTETVDGRPLDKITWTAHVTYAPPMNKNPPGSFLVKSGKLEVDDSKGTLYFDAAAGRLARSAMTMTVKGDLGLDASGTAFASKFRQELTTKTRVLDKKPAEK